MSAWVAAFSEILARADFLQSTLPCLSYQCREMFFQISSGFLTFVTFVTFVNVVTFATFVLYCHSKNVGKLVIGSPGVEDDNG